MILIGFSFFTFCVPDKGYYDDHHNNGDFNPIPPELMIEYSSESYTKNELELDVVFGEDENGIINLLVTYSVAYDIEIDYEISSISAVDYGEGPDFDYYSDGTMVSHGPNYANEMTGKEGTLVIPENTMKGFIKLVIMDDTIVEDMETFMIRMVAHGAYFDGGYDILNCYVHIQDNDGSVFDTNN